MIEYNYYLILQRPQYLVCSTWEWKTLIMCGSEAFRSAHYEHLGYMKSSAQTILLRIILKYRRSRPWCCYNGDYCCCLPPLPGPRVSHRLQVPQLERNARTTGHPLSFPSDWPCWTGHFKAVGKHLLCTPRTINWWRVWQYRTDSGFSAPQAESWTVQYLFAKYSAGIHGCLAVLIMSVCFTD